MVKILTVSDVPVDLVHSPMIAERFRDVDLVLSCGDLPFDYLEYIATMLGKPLYYVYGNHTQQGMLLSDGSTQDAPEGCINIHCRVIHYRGLLIAGLEGSMRYRPGDHQYTQTEMRLLALSLMPRLELNKLRYGRALDILITHAPPYKIHDGEDLCHQGFQVFHGLMKRYQPRYLIHGHVHLYRQDMPRVTQYGATTILNTYGYQLIELDETQLGRKPQSHHAEHRSKES